MQECKRQVVCSRTWESVFSTVNWCLPSTCVSCALVWVVTWIVLHSLCELLAFLNTMSWKKVTLRMCRALSNKQSELAAKPFLSGDPVSERQLHHLALCAEGGWVSLMFSFSVNCDRICLSWVWEVGKARRLGLHPSWEVVPTSKIKALFWCWELVVLVLGGIALSEAPPASRVLPVDGKQNSGWH